MDGKLERTEKGVLITVQNEPWSLDMPGVICINSDQPEKKRLYQKEFFNKIIYFPDEYEQAISDQIAHEDNFVVSMNGYSRISDDQCLRYGIQKGAYEEACKALMNNVINYINDKFTGVKLSLIHGASDMGVDQAIQDVADKHNILPLGFSCPRYMLYVKDDKQPVYVGSNKEEYSDKYIQSLDLLIATGGREQALQHDVLASCIYNKRIHFIDVLNSLSSTGGVPATIMQSDGSYKVDNAAAAMGRNISFFARHDAVSLTPVNGDLWDAIFDNVNSIASQVCRQKLSPKRKFKNNY